MLGFICALALSQTAPTLTPAETRAGWKLLFDGKTTKGWVNFQSDKVAPGWTIQDGALTITDPGNAGDIMTTDKFDWFELSIDYKVGKGQNSGIMFHVTGEGQATWHSGPEIQILDNTPGAGGPLAGWLYGLYSSPIDATHPSGEWNTVRLIVTPQKCETWMNGKKYYDFVLGSDDFKERVAKSKFGKMPFFAKKTSGSIAIQGDHGFVSFRNIKIRTLKAK